MNTRKIHLVLIIAIMLLGFLNSSLNANREVSLCDIARINCHVNCIRTDWTGFLCDVFCVMGWAWCVTYVEATGFAR